MRLALPALLLFLSAIPCAASLSAQERTRDETQDRSRREAPDRSRVTPSVGLTRVPLGYQWGGGLKAASAAIGMSMRAIRESGIRISARALVPIEGRAAIPDCVPEAGGCKEYRTPNALFDFSAGAYTGSKDGIHRQQGRQASRIRGDGLAARIRFAWCRNAVVVYRRDRRGDCSARRTRLRAGYRAAPGVRDARRCRCPHPSHPEHRTGVLSVSRLIDVMP